MILEFEQEKVAFLARNGFEMHFEQEIMRFSARNEKRATHLLLGRPPLYAQHGHVLTGESP